MNNLVERDERTCFGQLPEHVVELVEHLPSVDVQRERGIATEGGHGSDGRCSLGDVGGGRFRLSGVLPSERFVRALLELHGGVEFGANVLGDDGLTPERRGRLFRVRHVDDDSDIVCSFGDLPKGVVEEGDSGTSAVEGGRVRLEHEGLRVERG